MAKIAGYVVLTILTLALVAFGIICAVSAITRGGAFDLFRQWFGIAEKVAESTLPENAEAVSTVGRTLKSILHI